MRSLRRFTTVRGGRSRPVPAGAGPAIDPPVTTTYYYPVYDTADSVTKIALTANKRFQVYDTADSATEITNTPDADPPTGKATHYDTADSVVSVDYVT